MEFKIYQTDAITADIAIFHGRSVLSNYDKSIDIYRNGIKETNLSLPIPVSKIISHGNYLAGICYTSGLVLVFNKEIQLVQVVEIPNPLALVSCGEFLVVGNKDSLIKLKVTERNHNVNPKVELTHEDIHRMISKPEILVQIPACGSPTAMDYSNGRTLVGMGNIFKVYDSDLTELYSKEVSSCITAATFFPDGVLIGMLDGKVLCQNLTYEVESFIFNAHVITKEDTKIFYPVTGIMYDGNMISSGGDGRILKWDLSKKTSMGSVFDGGRYIRAFRKMDRSILILEDDPLVDSGNRVYYMN